jgi:hypothetical protein
LGGSGSENMQRSVDIRQRRHPGSSTTSARPVKPKRSSDAHRRAHVCWHAASASYRSAARLDVSEKCADEPVDTHFSRSRRIGSLTTAGPHLQQKGRGLKPRPFGLFVRAYGTMALMNARPFGVPTPVTLSQSGPVVSEVSVPNVITNQRVENGLLYRAL